MSDIEEVVDCPLGHTCVSIGADKKIHRCAWHIKMAGTDQSGKKHDEWNCAIAWQPILMVELSSTGRSTAAAVESLRNETVKRQDAALSIAVRRSRDDRTIEHK